MILSLVFLSCSLLTLGWFTTPAPLLQLCSLAGSMLSKSFQHIMPLCMLSCFSCVWLFETLWTVAPWGPLCMKFSRQEYWILEWAAMLSFRESSGPRYRTHISCYSCSAGRFLTTEPLGGAQSLAPSLDGGKTYFPLKFLLGGFNAIQLTISLFIFCPLVVLASDGGWMAVS